MSSKGRQKIPDSWLELDQSSQNRIEPSQERIDLQGPSTCIDFVVKTARLPTKNRSKNNSSVLASCCFLNIRWAMPDSVSLPSFSNWATVVLRARPDEARFFRCNHFKASGSTGEAINGKWAFLWCSACECWEWWRASPDELRWIVDVVRLEWVLERTFIKEKVILAVAIYHKRQEEGTRMRELEAIWDTRQASGGKKSNICKWSAIGIRLRDKTGIVLDFEAASKLDVVSFGTHLKS